MYVYCAEPPPHGDEGRFDAQTAAGNSVLPAAEERLFARAIEFSGRLKPDRVERNWHLAFDACNSRSQSKRGRSGTDHAMADDLMVTARATR